MVTQGTMNVSLCKEEEPQTQASEIFRLGLGCLLIQISFTTQLSVGRTQDCHCGGEGAPGRERMADRSSPRAL